MILVLDGQMDNWVDYYKIYKEEGFNIINKINR